MDEIRTLVVDDEIAFVKSLKSIIALSNRKTLSLIGNARTVEEAQSKIEEFEPDLVFLDIKLPDGTGFDVLNRCERQDFKVVFITAYDEFAVEAFKHSAVDYLLKPVSSDDLWKAIDKVQSELSSKDRELQINILMENLLELKSERKKLVLREGENMHVVSLREIRWCEAQGSYTHFHLEKGEELLVCHQLTRYERCILKNPLWARVAS